MQDTVNTKRVNSFTLTPEATAMLAGMAREQRRSRSNMLEFLIRTAYAQMLRENQESCGSTATAH